MLGLGTDIVEIAKMAKSLEKSSFLERCFCPSEIDYFNQHPRLTFLAGRFAGKEATVKALGTGLIDGLSLQDIEIIRSASGAPALRLHNMAQEIASALGVTKFYISISHTPAYATAVVILE